MISSKQERLVNSFGWSFVLGDSYLVYNVLYIFVSQELNDCLKALSRMFLRSLFIAAFVYKWNGLLARFAMLITAFVFFLLLGFTIDALCRTS